VDTIEKFNTSKLLESDDSTVVTYFSTLKALKSITESSKELALHGINVEIASRVYHACTASLAYSLEAACKNILDMVSTISFDANDVLYELKK